MSYGKATAYLPVRALRTAYCHIEDRDDLRAVRAKVPSFLDLCFTPDLATEVTLQPAALTLIADGPVSQEVLLTDLRSNPLTLRGLTTSAPYLRARR